MALSSALKLLLQQNRGPFAWGLNLFGPGLTAQNWSDVAYASIGIAQYKPRVLQWGPISYSLSDRSGSLSAVETNVTITDADRYFSRLAEGSGGRSLLRAGAYITLMNPLLASSDWATLFTGVIEAWDYPDAQTANLQLRVDDIAMRRAIPGDHWKITPYEWRSAPAANWNKFAPILFGSWNQADYTNTGAVPLLLMDPTNDIWLVCAGRAKAVNRVYVNGTASANWTMQYVTRGGKWFTVVDWSSTPPADDDEVTADVDGYEYVGDGTGEMIETPLNQMLYFLANFVFNQWRSGAWLSPVTESRTNNDSVEAVGGYLDIRGYRSARRIAEETSGYEELATWLKTNELRAYWDNLGEIAFDVEDWDIGYYLTSGIDSSQEAEFRIEVERDRVLSGVTLNYTQNAASGDYSNAVSVIDQRVTEKAEEVIDQAWGAAS